MEVRQDAGGPRLGIWDPTRKRINWRDAGGKQVLVMTEDIDLAHFDAQALGRWVFDRPVPDDPEGDCWYANYSFGNTAQPEKLLNTLTTLFNDYKSLAMAYSRPQMDQGAWAILGDAGARIGQYFAWPSITLATRMGCIHSMHRVFADVVDPLQAPWVESCYSMWWDLVCSSFWEEIERPAAAISIPQKTEEMMALLQKAREAMALDIDAEWRDLTPEQFQEKARRADAVRAAEAARHFAAVLTEDQRTIQNALLETLLLVLEIENTACQSSALHGLGHLHHPRVATIVQSYINKHAELWPDGGLEYLESCRDGTVL